jgi:hypothetical protein
MTLKQYRERLASKAAVESMEAKHRNDLADHYRDIGATASESRCRAESSAAMARGAAFQEALELLKEVPS